MLSALEALERLKEGNHRYATEDKRSDAVINQNRRREIVSGQEPFAIILGCSDSRVPAEIIFDQGLGDLFVIRVAGNIVAPSQIGSVEFAADAFGTRLVVVMGHSNCGAVSATLDQLARPMENRSPNILAIVNRIRPSVEILFQTAHREKPEDLMKLAVRTNVRASVNQLRNSSQLLERLIQTDGLLVVGAEYSLETGLVDFFDMMPQGQSPYPATSG